MSEFKPHRHEKHGYEGKSHVTLQGHVKAWHPGLGPPGVEQDASWGYLARQHQREHESQELLPQAGLVIHTHDWEQEPGLGSAQPLGEHLREWHGVPAPDGLMARVAEHKDLHDQPQAPAAPHAHGHAGGYRLDSQAALREHVNRQHPQAKISWAEWPKASWDQLEKVHRWDHPDSQAADMRSDAPVSRQRQDEPVDGWGPARQDSGAPEGLYEQISLQLSHTWPGELYLRFEAPGGAVTMVRVNAADRALLRALLKEED